MSKEKGLRGLVRLLLFLLTHAKLLPLSSHIHPEPFQNGKPSNVLETLSERLRSNLPHPRREVLTHIHYTVSSIQVESVEIVISITMSITFTQVDDNSPDIRYCLNFYITSCLICDLVQVLSLVSVPRPVGRYNVQTFKFDIPLPQTEQNDKS